MIQQTERNKDLPNIGVTEKFARNNQFELGQTIKLGFFDKYEEFYIAEIVNTPEGIYPRANNYIWSDNPYIILHWWFSKGLFCPPGNI